MGAALPWALATAPIAPSTRPGSSEDVNAIQALGFLPPSAASTASVHAYIACWSSRLSPLASDSQLQTALPLLELAHALQTPHLLWQLQQ
jgi:hypothetical protein